MPGQVTVFMLGWTEDFLLFVGLQCVWRHLSTPTGRNAAPEREDGRVQFEVYPNGVVKTLWKMKREAKGKRWAFEMELPMQ